MCLHTRELDGCADGNDEDPDVNDSGQASTTGSGGDNVDIPRPEWRNRPLSDGAVFLKDFDGRFRVYLDFVEDLPPHFTLVDAKTGSVYRVASVDGVQVDLVTGRPWDPEDEV